MATEVSEESTIEKSLRHAPNTSAESSTARVEKKKKKINVRSKRGFYSNRVWKFQCLGEKILIYIKVKISETIMNEQKKFFNEK